MNIQIENPVYRTTLQSKIFAVVGVAHSVNTLDELEELLNNRKINLNDNGIIFGKGSNHIWVSLAENNVRILLITE